MAKRVPAHLPGTKIKLPPALAPLLVPIDSIHEDPANPRKTLDIGHLVGLMKRFGYLVPVVVNADGLLLAGHQRRRACVQLGARQIPAIPVDHDPITGTAYNIADNRSNEVVAGWDDAALVPLLAKLQAEDSELAAALGWAEDELAAMLAPPAEPTAAGTEDEPPQVEPPADPVCQAGDLLKMGPHRLICGDCRDPAVVARLLGDERINVAFTSPPYASQRKYDESSGFKPIPPDEYVDWFEAVQANVRAHLADDGSWFVNIKEHVEDGERLLYVKDLTVAHRRVWGWRFVDELCWVRNSFPGGFAARFKNGWEPVFHFATAKDLLFRPTSVAKPSEHAIKYDASTDFGADQSGYSEVNGKAKQAAQHEGMALPSNVITCSNDHRGHGHSAAFPITLPTHFILAYSDEGATIFDPFMGSGTTMLASHRTKRVAYGCEVSPRYCDVIATRWRAESGEAAIIIRGDDRIAFAP